LEGDLPVKRDYSSGKGSPIHSSELPVELQETLIGLLLGDLHCPLQLHTYAAAGLGAEDQRRTLVPGCPMAGHRSARATPTGNTRLLFEQGTRSTATFV
jgi:hypothetical protein